MTPNVLFYSACALALVALPAAAQSGEGTKLGLKAGASVATLDGVINANSKFRTDFVAGPMLRLAPTKQHFTVQLEALISGQGADLELRNGATETRKIYYLNVPVLLRQYIGGAFYVNVGPQLGVLLGSGTGTYKSVEGGVVGGIGVETAGGFVVDLRLNYGLSDINDDAAERAFRKQLGLGGLHNRVI
ncbi:outer membrane beta-barrel protein [Hymenobacter chitinivorans]|uniref:Outer membrane protein with beta-barrel domain n=1 Tax=Hymenobacter chitinivorans DSM 11115 TaxID=1121954 RepID=A0A2M9AS90_9BACT|nr:outer membrane beta-barrel protein [Hymenobacter chitinivorans]PJJ48574.1 outer membrane protein with beta-barrel domain [Hymenobacter chitinivorans DSM 11115]